MKCDGGGYHYVSIPAHPSLVISGNLTVTVLTRFRASNSNHPILSRWNPGNLLMNAGGGTTDHMKFVTRVGGVNVAALSANTYNDGKWHHYTGVYNGANVLLYIDGGRTEFVTGDASAGPLDATTQTTYIGAYDSSSTAGYNGDVAIITIHNRAMSGEEIARLSADPFVLFRRREIAYFFGTAAAGGTGTPMHYYRRRRAG